MELILGEILDIIQDKMIHSLNPEKNPGCIILSMNCKNSGPGNLSQNAVKADQKAGQRQECLNETELQK